MAQQGRFYIYLPTNKKYNYPKVSGLLYNTNEKRFSFLIPIDESGSAIGDISGKAIAEFQQKNPGVQIVKVEIKRIGSAPNIPNIVIPPASTAPSVTQPEQQQVFVPVVTLPTTQMERPKNYSKFLGIGIAGILVFYLFGGKKRKR